MWQKFRKQEGFTLIELVVVVAILGLLAVIVTPKVMGAIENAKNNSSQSSAKQIQVAMERYNAEQGKYPPGLTLCGSTWTSQATTCPPAEMKKALAGYVNLESANINATATYEEVAATTSAPANYKLVITFKESNKAYTITADSIAAN